MAKRNRRGQFQKGKRRRSRRSRGVNLLQTAETFLLLNAVSNGATGLGIIPFLTSNEKVGSSNSSANRITLKELLTRFNTPHHGSTLTESDLVMKNIKANWMSMAGQMIAIPIAFRLGKKLAKPALTRTRALLKQAGLKDTVTV